MQVHCGRLLLNCVLYALKGGYVSSSGVRKMMNLELILREDASPSARITAFGSVEDVKLYLKVWVLWMLNIIVEVINYEAYEITIYFFAISVIMRV